MKPLHTLIDQFRAAWNKGPVPCWTDYLYDTASKR
jgi:hypothetical protein